MNNELPMWYCKRCKDFVSKNDITIKEINIKSKNPNEADYWYDEEIHKYCGEQIDIENSHKYMSEEYNLYKEWVRTIGHEQLEYAKKMARLRHGRNDINENS